MASSAGSDETPMIARHDGSTEAKRGSRASFGVQLPGAALGVCACLRRTPVHYRAVSNGDLPPVGPRHRRVCGLVSLAVMFVGTVFSAIWAKRTAIAAPAFPFAVSILSPISGVVVYTLVVAVGRLLPASSPLHIPANTCSVPWRRAAVVGLLFCAHNVLQNLGNRGAVVPGPVVLVVLKLVVPATVVLTWTPGFRNLRRRLQWTHYAAVSLVLLGAACAVAGLLLDAQVTKEALLYTAILVVGVVPLAAAFLVVEHVTTLEQPDVNPVYLWACICAFETAAGVPLSVANALMQGLEFNLILQNAWQGAACLVAGAPAGVHNVTTAVHGAAMTAYQVNCTAASTFFMAEKVPGFAVNFAFPVAIRFGGATLVWFVRALALPVAAALFGVPALMGADVTESSTWEIVGLCTVFVALLVYRQRDDPLLALSEPATVDRSARPPPLGR